MASPGAPETTGRVRSPTEAIVLIRGATPGFDTLAQPETQAPRARGTAADLRRLTMAIRVCGMGGGSSSCVRRHAREAGA